MTFQRISEAQIKLPAQDRPIDPHAVTIPRNSGLGPCLYVPIAARDVNAIERYVGRIVAHLTPDDLDRALLVEAYEPEKADERLPIWAVPGVKILHTAMQVWVDVDYRPYRRAYLRAFPDADLTAFVLDHVMNRRVARLKGFQYLRIVPISRGANSSHGGLSEGWAAKYHGSPEMMAKNRASLASVQYADLADIVKMLDIQGGGSLMENVNEAQKLVELPDASGQR
jgi:hypothetical protein